MELDHGQSELVLHSTLIYDCEELYIFPWGLASYTALLENKKGGIRDSDQMALQIDKTSTCHSEIYTLCINNFGLWC